MFPFPNIPQNKPVQETIDQPRLQLNCQMPEPNFLPLYSVRGPAIISDLHWDVVWLSLQLPDQPDTAKKNPRFAEKNTNRSELAFRISASDHDPPAIAVPLSANRKALHRKVCSSERFPHRLNILHLYPSGRKYKRDGILNKKMTTQNRPEKKECLHGNREIKTCGQYRAKDAKATMWQTRVRSNR